MTVGVLVPDITNTIFPPIIRGIEDVLARSNYVAILGNSDGDRDRVTRIIDSFLNRGVDGLVLASVEKEDGQCTTSCLAACRW